MLDIQIIYTSMHHPNMMNMGCWTESQGAKQENRILTLVNVSVNIYYLHGTLQEQALHQWRGTHYKHLYRLIT